ncbi:MAG: hemolysin family protein [Myxococcota bacterium]
MILTFIACVVLMALVSAAETALTSLSETKTRQLIETKRKRLQVLKLWLEHPNRVLTTLLIANNAAGALSASLATVIVEEFFGNYVIGIAAGITTLVMLIFGEVTPKTFARHNAEFLAPILLNLLRPLYWLFYPLVFILSWIAAIAVRILGGKTTSDGPLATEEDIDYMIRLGNEEGVLASEEGAMLQSVIEFRDTLVKGATVPRTQICSFDTSESLDEIRRQVLEHGHSRYPVYEDNIDNIIGIFHSKDLLTPGLKDWKKMIRPALFVPEMMRLWEVLKEFRRGKTHLAIVVDEYGGTAGIISLEDVLEEIVGEIRDEYDDEEEHLFTQLPTGEFEASGLASIYELGEALRLTLDDDEDYETLAGFLIAIYGKMPMPGTEIEFQEWRFIVEQTDGKKIERVKICPILTES